LQQSYSVSDSIASRSGWNRQGSVAEHLRRYGYDQVLLKVDALSSTANNARQIRDALLTMPVESGPARLVLIGYSKGAPDILDALVRYPEIRNRVAAVVSAAGAVGGSPLANDAEEYHAEMLRQFPARSASLATALRSRVCGLRHAEPGSSRIHCRRTCVTTRWPRSRSRNASQRC
jgi:pimeloyl-ACP methyl ester carboxylesterase